MNIPPATKKKLIAALCVLIMTLATAGVAFLKGCEGEIEDDPNGVVENANYDVTPDNDGENYEGVLSPPEGEDDEQPDRAEEDNK